MAVVERFTQESMYEIFAARTKKLAVLAKCPLLKVRLYVYVRSFLCVCLQKVDQGMPGSFTLVSKQRIVIQKGDRCIEMKYSKRLAN